MSWSIIVDRRQNSVDNPVQAGLSRSGDAGRSAKADAPRIEGGARIVLTAPLTEIIDHAGYFIQMSMASLPMWLEGILNKKYPEWRKVEYNEDGSARYMPAGVRVLEKSLLRRFDAASIVCCYPQDLDR